jgi:SMI1-KNR4 cell-wall
METPFDEAMARIHFRYVRPPNPVTLDDIRNLEREIGYPLPPDYRDFLMKYGLAAGRGDTRFTNANDPEEVETSVDVFYGLKRGDTYDLRGMRRRFSDRLPPHLLPIASGSGGEFCLSLGGEDAGRVYWWFQETGKVQSAEDLEPIADSFAEFVNSLVCVEE